MKRILHSLYGKVFGTTDDSRILAPGGVLLGDYGNQFCDPAPDRVVTFDDFDGAALLGVWGLLKGTDAAATNFAIFAALNGVARGVTGATTATMAGSGVQISGHLNFAANSGDLEFNSRVRLSSIANVAIFVGLTNQVAALQDPANGAGGGNGFTFNAADCVGVVYDTTMTTKDWWLVGNAANVNAVAQDSLLAPAANVYDTWAISVSKTGIATFFRNGLQVGVAMNGAITPGTPVAPVIAAFSRAAASVNVDSDYVYGSCKRV